MTNEIITTTSGALGLPIGSVRAVIVLVLIAIAGIFLFLNKTIPEWLVAMVVMAVTFYFGSKSSQP